MDKKPGEINVRHVSDTSSGATERERIRENIEETRAEMSETVDTLQESLSPQHIATQVKETVRSATIGRAEDMMQNVRHTTKATGSSVIDTIKHNPIPAAMIGIGAAWLMIGRSSTASSRYDRYDRYDRSGTRYRAYAYDIPREQRRGTIGDAAEQLQEKTGDLAGQAREHASYLADQARGQADYLLDQAEEASQTFQDVLHDNPLAAGAAALAVGAAVGLALPHSAQEDQIMGSARDNLIDQARSAAEDTVNKVKHVVDAAQT